MKILVIALSGIGDALMFTPALKLLCGVSPGSKIDALVMFRGVKDLFERNKYIDNVLHFDFLKEGAASSLKYILGLRKKYDITINIYPSNRKEYNIINFLIGARKRAGVQYLRKDAKNLGFLNNFRIVEDDYTHNVQTNIKLVEKLFNIHFDEEPDLEFFLTGEDNDYASNYLNNLRLNDSDLLIGFHPGSAVLKNHISRRWEPEKFIGLGKKLIKELNAKVLIFGGPDEDELKSYISNKINSELSPQENNHSIAVSTKNLAQTAAIIKHCSIFVSNDSSLMHVASAMKLKVIAIIGPTNQAYIHPWKTKHTIVSLNLNCSPCFIYSPRPLICFRDDVKFKCIKELNVEMVFQAVLDSLN